MNDLATAIITPSAPAFPRKFRGRASDIPKNPLFSALSRQQMHLIQPFLKRRRFKRGKKLLQEGSRNRGRIFIVVDGQVAIAKDGVSPIDKTRKSYEIGVLRRGEIFGEASFIEGTRSAATYTAKTGVNVCVLDLTAAGRSLRVRRIKNIVATVLRRNASKLGDHAIALMLRTARMETELAAYRNGVGHIIVTTLLLLSLYTLMMSFLPSFKQVSHANMALSPLIILMFTLSFLPVIANSGLPLAFFGLRLDNWRAAAALSLRASALFLFGFVLIKWLLINTSSAFADLSLIGVPAAEAPNTGDGAGTTLYWVGLIVYLMLTPLQEFVARSGIQAPLFAFLHGSEAKRRWVSIFVANMVFTAAHAHISAAFALAAFLPGILWGWIFARTGSLVAVTLSHLIIGGSTIFLFGVEAVVEKFAIL